MGIRYFTPPENIELQALEQIKQTASLSFVVDVAVMPDVHYGKGSTVGTVVVTDGAIMPACVGVDIGCGMIASRTAYAPEAVRKNAKSIREGIERRIPVGVGLRGMIYASKLKYPIAYQCVDAVIYNTNKHQVLLGKKKRDGDKWRFIGGFVSPKDNSLEEATMREVREETGIEPLYPFYIGSTKVNDFRYPENGTDSLMSAVFIVESMFGAGVASDDIDECRWFPIPEVKKNLVAEHLPHYALLHKHFAGDEGN